jgi:hypothetical protein
MNDIARSLIDHVIIACRDLEDASRNWQQLGFNLSAQGAHASRGTLNRCIPFPNAYLELLAPNPEGCHEEFLLKTLRQREGGTSIALAMDSKETVYRSLRRSLPTIEPPVTGSREIIFENTRDRISFDVQRIAPDALWPGRFFFCGHHHPDMVYQTELFNHPNGARRLARIVHCVPNVPSVWHDALDDIGFRPISAAPDQWVIECRGVELVLAERKAVGRYVPAAMTGPLPEAPAPVLLEFESSSEAWIAADRANGIVLHFRGQ